MKGGLMPAFTCAVEKSATTSTTKSTQKTCNAEFERKDVPQRNLEASPDERRVCSRLHNSELSSDSIRKKDASRRIRPSGGKDRHSKVNTAKGLRDRRVRLSVSTAIQFYDVQDRLGFDQPSKAVEWLMREAKTAIDELPQLPGLSQIHRSNITVSRSNTRQFSAHEATASPFLSSSASRGSGTLNAAGSIGGLESLVGISDAARSEDESVGVAGKAFPSEAQVHATGDLSKAIDSQGAGSTSARIELRTKARERARERAKQRFLAARNDRESIVLSPPDHHLENIAPMASPADEHIHKFHLHSLVEDDQTPSSFRHVFKNNVHTEQMQATSDPLSSYPAFVHETVVHRFHNKSRKLPNLLNQAPSQSWPLTITTDQCSPGSLYCSSRPFFPSFLDSNMAFRQDSSARLLSCNSNAVSQLAVFEVPISSFTGTIMPADRIPIISLDPSQSAFRPTTQLPASLEERAALYSDHPSIKRISRAQPSSFDSKTNHILLNSQAAGVSHLASFSAFEQYASNQFPGTTSYIRASSDFQHYHDHALFSAIDSETLQSHDLKLPERLRGLDDIEEQLKRYSQN